MTGVSGVVGNIPNPEIGDEVEFSGVGSVTSISRLAKSVWIATAAGDAFVPVSSVRVVVPPLKRDDVIDEEHRTDLNRLPLGTILSYHESPAAVPVPYVWQKIDDGVFWAVGSEGSYDSDQVTLPVRIVALGGES